MHHQLAAAGLLAATLSACQAVPAPMATHILRFNGIAGTDFTLPLYYPEGDPVKPVSIEASDNVRGLGAARAIDGDASTAWVSADPHAPEATLTVRFAQPMEFRGIRIKTGPTPDATTFKVKASDDGTTWRPVSGRMANLTWGFEPQLVGGNGTYLRLHFFNSQHNAHARFSVYELQVYGRPLR